MARTARTERQQLEEAGRTKALLKQMLLTTESDSWDFLYKALLDQLHFELFSPTEWRHLITGQKALTPYKLNWIEQAFSGAREFYDDGPWGIWRALFSPARDLWALHHGGNSSVEQAIHGFEKRLLTLKKQIEPEDFVEAIALYRLHATLRDLAPLDVDVRGVYRCVRTCQQDCRVSALLAHYGIEYEVMSILSEQEIDKLNSDKQYNDAIGIKDIAHSVFMRNQIITTEQRVAALRQNEQQELSMTKIRKNPPSVNEDW